MAILRLRAKKVAEQGNALVTALFQLHDDGNLLVAVAHLVGRCVRVERRRPAFALIGYLIGFGAGGNVRCLVRARFGGCFLRAVFSYGAFRVRLSKSRGGNH